MGILDTLRGGTVAAMPDSDPTVELAEQLRAEQETNLLLTESLIELEQDVRGWSRLGAAQAIVEFSRAGLNDIAEAARLHWIANPLIRRAVNVRTHYTWGQGVAVQARADEVNDVVQAFIDDEANQNVLFGHEARQSKDRSLQLDGNVFLACFTNPLTGRVQLRTIPFAEITDIACDPQDAQRRWFYVREWTETGLDLTTGATTSASRKAYYPDLSYRPMVRPRSIGGVDVVWDGPLLAVQTGALDGAKFGMSEVYPALPWARAYKGFLEDWASLAKSLSRFAWRGKTKSSRVPALRRAMETRDDRSTVNSAALPDRPAAGQAFVADPDSDLTPISKTGATLDADSGRPLAMLVGAALDVPYTILMGDADTGNLATAKTLDRPTELAMGARRDTWGGVYRRLFNYAVDQAVKAPQGPLTGTVLRPRDDRDREVITLASDLDRTVDVTWPSLLEHDVAELVAAIVAADSTMRVPPEVICRLLLQALGVDDVDELMAELIDDNGEFIDPGLAAQASAGQAAADAFRRGQDPVGAVQ